MKIADADTEVRASSSGLSRHPGDRPQARGVMSDRRSMVFAAALSTIFMAAIEGTIVATAMPTIVGALGGLDLFSWIFGAYLLTQAVMIPIYGRVADVYGGKPILLFGIGVFLAGSVLCGLSWNMTSLIVFRVVQGIGAGSLVPLSQTGRRHIQRRAARPNAGLHLQRVR